jgi:hypothetical protein
MSRNIMFVLMYHGHKHLDLTYVRVTADNQFGIFAINAR